MSSEANQAVLVLAPHPDDETFGCGGTIKHMTSFGTTVDVAFMTRGENGFESTGQAQPAAQLQLATRREGEARQACRILGVSQTWFLNGSDGRLLQQPEMAPVIARLLNQGNYQRVFCPWVEEAHDDHRATFQWLCHALTLAPRAMDVWLYEVWTPLKPNMVLPIDATVEAKQHAIDVYRSQLDVLDYRAGFMGLSAYRGLFCSPSRYAEAFITCDSSSLPKL